MAKLFFSIILFIGLWNLEDGYGMISNENIIKLYQEIGIEDKIDMEIFKLSIIGLNQLKKTKTLDDDSILTIIDFSKPSTEERFFVLDLQKRKLLFSSLVAHGKNSGWDLPNEFSNRSGSLKSSLGFFLTAGTYYGKHGYSLKLKGLESSINDKAEDRAIVIHKARYVSEEFIKKYGRLGRSWGCPALPVTSAGKIIDEIKNGTCLFIYAKSEEYLLNSKLLNKNTE